MPKADEKNAKRSKSARIKLALERLKKMQAEKSPWIPNWQTVSENFLTRKATFTGEKTEGQFLHDESFDGTGPGALMKFASAVLGMMWPNGAKSVMLDRTRQVRDTEEVREYYQKITEVSVDEMDNPRAGLQVALDEYMIDQGGFGTSGVSCMPGKKSKLMFKAENVKFMCIAEGPDGFVDTIYLEIEWDIRQAVKEYGLDSLSQETQKAWRDGKEDQKVRILFCVQPRMDIETDSEGEPKQGIHGMEFESMHIEVDKKHMIRESGFNELPIKVARFRKALGEKYGRSPAMDALPDVQELNAIWEALTILIEKKADPALVVYDDGMLGGNEIDSSAGAVTVLNVSGRAGGIQEPIQQLHDIGEPTDAVGLVERLENSVANHFLLDRLLDFNNENVMTLGEVNVRNRIRGFLLGSIFARQTAELFTPLVERAVNILYDMGELGVIDGSPQHQKLISEGRDPDEIIIIPDEVAKHMKDKKGRYTKKPPFRIKYISPAARILQSEQAQGIVQTLDFILSASQVNPEAADNMDVDEATQTLAFVYGAPGKIMHSKEKREAIRTGRMEALNEAKLVDAAPKAADAVKKMAEANSYGLMKGSKNGKQKAAA